MTSVTTQSATQFYLCAAVVFEALVVAKGLPLSREVAQNAIAVPVVVLRLMREGT